MKAFFASIAICSCLASHKASAISLRERAERAFPPVDSVGSSTVQSRQFTTAAVEFLMIKHLKSLLTRRSKELAESRGPLAQRIEDLDNRLNVPFASSELESIEKALSFADAELQTVSEAQQAIAELNSRPVLDVEAREAEIRGNPRNYVGVRSIEQAVREVTGRRLFPLSRASAHDVEQAQKIVDADFAGAVERGGLTAEARAKLEDLPRNAISESAKAEQLSNLERSLGEAEKALTTKLRESGVKTSRVMASNLSRLGPGGVSEVVNGLRQITEAPDSLLGLFRTERLLITRQLYAMEVLENLKTGGNFFAQSLLFLDIGGRVWVYFFTHRDPGFSPILNYALSFVD